MCSRVTADRFAVCSLIFLFAADRSHNHNCSFSCSALTVSVSEWDIFVHSTFVQVDISSCNSAHWQPLVPSAHAPSWDYPGGHVQPAADWWVGPFRFRKESNSSSRNETVKRVPLQRSSVQRTRDFSESISFQIWTFQFALYTTFIWNPDQCWETPILVYTGICLVCTLSYQCSISHTVTYQCVFVWAKSMTSKLVIMHYWIFLMSQYALINLPWLYTVTWIQM